nr:unnamed protein product [Callosobruchus analis]
MTTLLTASKAYLYPNVKDTEYLTLPFSLIIHSCSCISSEPMHTMRVTLHFPSDIPDVRDNNFKVALGQSVTGVIIPQIIRTSDDVKRFSPTTRDCYFQSERSLRFFKIYSQANCLLECKTNYTLKFCGCVGYDMPNDAFFVANYYSAMEDEVNYTKFAQCDCLPKCTDISYRLELSQNSFSPEFVPWAHPKKVFECSQDIDVAAATPSFSGTNMLLKAEIELELKEKIIKSKGINMSCRQICNSDNNSTKTGPMKDQRLTYSSYKHRNSFKGLVGVAPNSQFTSEQIQQTKSIGFRVNKCIIRKFNFMCT